MTLGGALLATGLLISGCAPMPQVYPFAPPIVQQPQPQPYAYVRPNNVIPVPQAAPLPPQQVVQQAPSVQRYAALPSGRPQTRTQVTTVPPTIQPLPRRASGNNRQVEARRTPQTGTPRTVTNYRRQHPPIPSVTTTQKMPASETLTRTPHHSTTSASGTWTISKSHKIQSQKKTAVEILDITKPGTQKPVVEKVVPPAPGYGSNPAILVLTKQANNQLVAGKLGRAASTLERALRIDPDNAMLWLRLAEVNEKQGKQSQAASMAKKAMILAPGDNAIKQRGRRLLN
ncbi:MAG: hypothetical protein CSA79_01365 [Thiothrix nivea]|nr:MAG: hypothetical protein CSA79_01365 [Thiothrix nivea]